MNALWKVLIGAVGLFFLAAPVFIYSISRAVEGKRYVYDSTPLKGAKQHAVIFLHGYYGANLSRVRDGSRLWLTLPEALWRSNTVARNEDDLGIEGAESLEEDGILLRIPLVPGLHSIDAYGGTLTWLERELPEAVVFPFAYDWRGDVRVTAASLGRFVDRVREDGASKVSLVAHSMGGLVVSYYLRYGQDPSENARETWAGAEATHRIVLAGVPFRGTMHLLRNIHQGVKLGLNQSLLQPEAVASFPSSYQLLPLGTGKVLDEKLKATVEDSSDWGWWEKENLGYAALPAATKEIRARRIAFSRKALGAAFDFREKIHRAGEAHAPPSGTKILTIVGSSRKTIDKVVWLKNAPQKLLFTDRDFAAAKLPYLLSDLQSDGDESVTRDSASLPPEFARKLGAREIITNAPHSDLLKDAKVRAEVIDFLR